MKRKDGFTLLEVLVALTILVIGIVAIMQLFPLSLMQARMANELTITAELANSVMGQIRASGAEALHGGKIPQNMLSTAKSVYEIYGLYEGYNTSVQRLNGSSEVFLQRVTFTVDFADGRQESFVTYVTKR